MGEANYAVATSSGSKSMKKKRAMESPSSIPLKRGTKKKTEASKLKCFFYGKKGHYKKGC